MTIDDLKTRLGSSPRPTLIDVLPKGSFEAEHLPGAANACVYETAFLGNVEQVVSGLESPLVVYDTGVRSEAAAEARRKLEAAGYTNVAVFEGGLEAWKAAGEPLEGSGAYQEPAPPSYPASLAVDTGSSALRWTGRNLANHHWGHLSLSEGRLEFEDGALSGGELVIDMQSIEVEDIEDATLAGYLIAHLRDADFFETATYPEARVRITGARPIPEATAGAPNLEVSAELTLKDVTRPLTFPATAGWSPDGKYAAQASIEFDRTQWNVRYGSGKFFDRLGMHMVADLVSLQVKVNAG